MTMLDHPVSRRRFLGAGLGLATLGAGAFSWLGPASAGGQTHRVSWYAFGTLVDVVLVDSDREKVNAAMLELATLLNRCNDDWHPWKPGVMQEINNAIQRGEAVAVDADMAAMVSQMQQLYTSSEGCFNPAIGQIVSLWGFHGGSDFAWTPPSNQAVEQLMAQAPSPLDLSLTGDLLKSTNRSVQLDLGGYAKDTEDEHLQHVNEFKDGFGGELVEMSNYISHPLVCYRKLSQCLNLDQKKNAEVSRSA